MDTSAHGSVRQGGSVKQCGSVRQCGSLQQCGVRQSGIVCGSASGSVWQCERQCAAVWCERQCMTVRAAACAAVRGSAAVYVWQ
jgi:hypothetical protein